MVRRGSVTEKFRTDGFVVVRGFLDGSQVDELRANVERYIADVVPGLEASEAFYERLLGVDLLVDQGWAKVYQASATGFIGLVDGARGLHQATEQKGVTVSFITADIQAWFARVQAQGLEMRSEEIGDESGRVMTFVAYDAEMSKT